MKIMSEKLVSICIPTRNRKEVLFNTLKSIDESNVDASDFDVVIYDSSDNNDIEKELIDLKLNYSVQYFFGPNNGYLNLISVLQLGNGHFLKLHNDYSTFTSDGLKNLINVIRNNLDVKSLFFFSNGQLNQGSKQFTDFDRFLRYISFYCSWSTCVGFWKDDFLETDKSLLTPMFPHTSILLQHYQKKSIYVDNTIYWENSIIKNKGGYELFKTFSIDFIEMLKLAKSEGIISLKTLFKIKFDLANKFFPYWYSNTQLLETNYSFKKENVAKSLLVNYTLLSYLLIVIKAHLIALKAKFKKS